MLADTFPGKKTAGARIRDWLDDERKSVQTGMLTEKSNLSKLRPDSDNGVR